MAADAGLRVRVESTLRQAVAQLEAQAERVIATAAARALNRAAVSTRAQAVREIRERYNIKAGAARAQMRIERASRSRLTAAVVVSGRPIPLIEFAARRVAAGVSVEVRRGRRLTLRGRFIATMKSGHVGVFERIGKFGRRGNPRLEKIGEKFTVGLPSMFTQRAVLSAIERVALQRFSVELARELRFRTGGARG